MPFLRPLAASAALGKRLTVKVTAWRDSSPPATSWSSPWAAPALARAKAAAKR